MDEPDNGDQPAPTDDDLLTVEEVAKILRISKTSVYRMINERALGHVDMPHGSVKVTRGQVRQFIEEMKVAAQRLEAV
jgi:excisionase family DNA binding protein